MHLILSKPLKILKTPIRSSRSLLVSSDVRPNLCNLSSYDKLLSFIINRVALFCTFSNRSMSFLPRDAMHKRGLCRHAVSVRPSVCLSLCVSVTFVDHVKMNKHIFKFFSPSGSHTILVIPYQTEWRYSDGNLTGRRMREG